MAVDPELRAHQEWLGYLQPVGLVVSPPALAHAGAFVNRNIVREQQTLLRLVASESVRRADGHAERKRLADLPRLCTEFLGWEASDLAGAPGGPPLPPELSISLPEYGETLAPSYAVADPDQPGRWLLLLQELPRGADFDAPLARDERGWHASPQARLERLLRETGVAVGLLSNGEALRLVHAPRGESSGHLTFPVPALCEVAGRPIVAALHMLLCAERLFALPSKQRLSALLQESRRYQNDVSTKLAEQVLAALNELLRGFQAANEGSSGVLLRDVLDEDPSLVYGGLLATLLRLVFVLYAEDRGLLPVEGVYAEHYSVAGLFEDLREDAGRFPDTMDQRFGAWARLLSLFRLIFDGAAHASLRLPPRHGSLFHPDAHPFLEGRPHRSVRQVGEVLAPPRVSDGVVFRVLQNLLLLDGDRISYRALDVEQIGSVYEAMMGFSLETATGASIGVRPEHVVVNLEELLAAKPADRAKVLDERAGSRLAGQALEAMKAAKTLDELVAALGKKLSPRTPRVLPAGALYLQPTEERRRSGSHYTPRSLTEPIVRTTLAPLLEALGPRPRPEEILELRVCDPAMGSGAFLVEACRFLGDALVEAWGAHGGMPAIPPDEDPQLFARRLVAQRCLYGVDKNPFAVDLAKLSLWLATLARDHPFTFLDHALRGGDSLVGLSREAIASFHWDVGSGKQIPNLREELARRVAQAVELRTRIQALAESDNTEAKASLLRDAEEALDDVRLAGDLVVASFFGEEKTKARETLRKSCEEKVRLWLGGSGDQLALEAIASELREGERPIPPFHWEIEFPEVFSRKNPGFDAFVGNPPFGGKNTVSASNREGYLEWLQALHEESHGNADLVAHFYRRAFAKLRENGAFGLIATNTIAQGDTRSTGLRWICTHGGAIYHVRKRVKWPGEAAVVVSVVHVAKGEGPARKVIDGREVERITAFLFHGGGHEDPARLAANEGKSFIGSYVLGMGFTFDDENPDGTPIAEMQRLVAKDPRNRDRIFPYIGGEELNDSPTHAHRRWIINFGEMSEDEARRWPELMRIVEEKVKPQRMKDNREAYKRYWWQYAEKRVELVTAIRGMERVLVNCQVSPHVSFASLPSGWVYAHTLDVFALDSHSGFCLLQSRAHELWARGFGSSMRDDLRYTPSSCFDTFPFPEGWESNAALEEAGRAYYEFRAGLMVRNDEGLTKTYNRFHDPDETSPEIAKLREFHAAMDGAVLDAYGWTELRPECKFLLDYEEEEDEDEAARPRRRKKPWRYRWPDELRDEVLARLLALNAERAAAEARAGATAKRDPASKPARKGRPRKKHPSSGTRDLFDE